MIRRLVCPQCKSGERLATIERVLGLCDSTFELDDKGVIDVEPGGETDVIWDSTETVGVQCRGCDWGIDDDHTEADLIPAVLDLDPDKWTEEEIERIKVGKCARITGWGLPWIEWCDKPRAYEDSPWCAEHEGE